MSGCGEEDLMNLGPFIQSYVWNSITGKTKPLIQNVDEDTAKEKALAATEVHSQTTTPQKTVVVISGQHLRRQSRLAPYKQRQPTKLTEKQHLIKRWLHANYSWCPRSKNAKVSSRLVQSRACKLFGPITQKALGNLLYQAFPGVERIKGLFKGIKERTNENSMVLTRGARSLTNLHQEKDDPTYLPDSSPKLVSSNQELCVAESDESHNLRPRVSPVFRPLEEHPGDNAKTDDSESWVKMESMDQGYESHNSETEINTGLNTVKREPDELVEEQVVTETNEEELEQSVVTIPPQSLRTPGFLPDTLEAAHLEIQALTTYIQDREMTFAVLEKDFLHITNEFRRLTHAFKQFASERATAVVPLLTEEKQEDDDDDDDEPVVENITDTL